MESKFKAGAVKRQIRHFDGIADRYQEARGKPNHMLLKELIWTEALAGRLNFDQSRVVVLEPMCGFADGKAILERFVDRPIVYCGYDYSARVIDLLRRKQPDLDVWRADATTFAPAANSFDVIILLGGLHHVPAHAGAIVRKLAAALAPGGRLINLEPTYGNRLSKWIRARIYRRNTLFDDETERDFAIDELLGFFQDAGLQPVDICYPGLLSYVLYYNPDAFPWLNVGGSSFVKTAFTIDRLFLRSSIGRLVSFATLSIWRRQFKT